MGILQRYRRQPRQHVAAFAITIYCLNYVGLRLLRTVVMNTTMEPAKNIDEYFALQPPKTRVALEKLRQIILSIAPDAEEVISYAMPAFKYHGMLVGFAAWKNHVGFYPWNSRTVEAFKEELKTYSTSKSAIQFLLHS